MTLHFQVRSWRVMLLSISSAVYFPGLLAGMELWMVSRWIWNPGHACTFHVALLFFTSHEGKGFTIKTASLD